LRIAWALFLILGAPLGFMVLLGPLAAAKIYIDPLRPLWTPWPSDLVKTYIGIAAFAATLAYLGFRIGHDSGFRWGNAAGRASARNEAEIQLAESMRLIESLPSPPAPALDAPPASNPPQMVPPPPTSALPAEIDVL
jgi:hypothetical protein